MVGAAQPFVFVGGASAIYSYFRDKKGLATSEYCRSKPMYYGETPRAFISPLAYMVISCKFLQEIRGNLLDFSKNV